MTITSIHRALSRLTAAACALACLAGTQAAAAKAEPSGRGASVVRNELSGTSGSKADATATLEQCLTALTQSERTATFVGEMIAVPGTARMEISIGLLERDTSEGQYRSVSAAGLGGWRISAQGVKNYTYIKQVTNLSAPAFYRGAVRFRWLNERGHVIKAEELHTPRCEQPAPPSSTESTPSTTTSGSSSAGVAATQID
jgi:hypothetical protein